MSDYRRYFFPGGMWFFTVVTYGRQPILTTDAGRRFLRAAISKVKAKQPFDLFANVLLPNHWHLILQLPAGDADYSLRLKQIKEDFSRNWLKANLSEAEVSGPQRQKGERGIWQSRFWEHMITDEDDLERCVDYIHWNPRKHGLARRVRDYPWSSFQRFVEAGQYGIDWGGIEPSNIANHNAEWGEPKE